MSDSFPSQVLRAALSAVLACAAMVVSRTMPSDQERAPERDRRSALVVGRDVSWPNCPKGMGIPSRRSLGHPMPPPSARFVIIGLTNGPAFRPNPCLRAQVDHARSRHMWAAAYAVVTHPTRDQLRRYGAAGPRRATTPGNRLWNTGWAQARQNVAAMRGVGLDSPVVWVDVEPVSPPAPWSDDRSANRAVLAGAVASYGDAGVRVGFYSTGHMWREILGPVRYRLPEWRTAGLSTRRAALRMCRQEPIQGGRAVIAQWYSTREDFNLLCPGRPAGTVLREYFTPF